MYSRISEISGFFFFHSIFDFFFIIPSKYKIYNEKSSIPVPHPPSTYHDPHLEPQNLFCGFLMYTQATKSPDGGRFLFFVFFLFLHKSRHIIFTDLYVVFSVKTYRRSFQTFAFPHSFSELHFSPFCGYVVIYLTKTLTV